MAGSSASVSSAQPNTLEYRFDAGDGLTSYAWVEGRRPGAPKIDEAQGKITLKHGEIRSLDMPPMTMVFQVKDVTLLDKVKAGDKIRFAAEKLDSGYVVTDIQAAK